ncbi:hypothetical protein QFC21_002049 [Naganishia friedmannii]|uniref:Uncharacterized protein n=1 Tax=Naganishia friedmannii TaxID=89922 RepID=A0ACC2W1P1_9TREE|nr:hypothetical protein QFC21_002049 [Naganishia friedmannii]
MAVATVNGLITPTRTRVFVVGLGMVGIAFIEKMLAQDVEGRYQIITCGEEPHFAYNRVGLTEYFNYRDVSKLYLNQPEWYTQQDQDKFQFHVGEQVTYVDTEKKIVTSTKGQYEYDICVIATGSDAADLEKIITYAEKPEINSATVVGGGLLGLEAAKAAYDLSEHLKEVSIINRQAYPLSRQLDADAGEMVMRKIEEMGVKCMTKVDVKSMLTKKDPEDDMDVFTGFEFSDDEILPADMVIMAVGITPRDDLARVSGIATADRGGIAVGDDLMTSAKDVYALGECASWRGNTYGLIGPGVEMADILAFNLCQTQTALGAFRPRKMNSPDLSTKLKLMGVDVASFGDFFADKANGRPQQPLVETVRNMGKPDHPNSKNLMSNHVPGESGVPQMSDGPPTKINTDRIVKIHTPPTQEPIKCLTYKIIYKKYIFSANGKHLLGGMMVGDCSDFVKLVSIIKKKKALDVAPSQFIVGAKSGEDDGADLDDDAQICSCHNVTKDAVAKCVKSGGCETIGDIKAKTKAGTGCGGCMPLVTNIFNAEMKKAGKSVSNNICIHFNYSRADLFNIVRIKKLDSFTKIMEECGLDKDSLGCEYCKPVIASLISSTAGINKHVMDPAHHANQDTNDRFLANIQRDGTYSVVPRMAAGEVTPDKLLVLAQVAQKYDLYTKITGGQRIDLFGAMKQDLPDIWEELVNAGFESGHAYGKSLRTVKSCVGSTWCRYGIGDSVGLAVQLEERYKGVRAPHKIKGGVSGCVRECAEAQGKDFGLIATDKGWNIYLGGNGGANPRHAQLFATDVIPTDVVKYIDRFLMFYIQTADKLTRTARWMENFDGGLEKLRKIIIDDELGICEQLDKDMNALVGTYECEWTRVVNEPERRKQFRQHVNTNAKTRNIELIQERKQTRAADWPKDFPSEKMSEAMIRTPKPDWNWRKVCQMADLTPTQAATTSCAVKIGDSQIAIYHVPKRGLFASQQMCPHKRAFVLDHGIIGEDKNNNVYVSCPLHKRNFILDPHSKDSSAGSADVQKGSCSTDSDYSIITFEAKEQDGDVYLLLPPEDALDDAIGTSKWMVKQATADVYGRGAATAVEPKSIELVGPKDEIDPNGGRTARAGCGDNKLDW